MLPCGKNQCQCQCKNSGRRILFLSWEPCSAGAGYYSAAARSHAANSCWCWITFRRSHEIPCLNTHENDSSEESFQSIKLAVMPVFGILKHLFDVSKTFSSHNNPSSHSGISDTFVLNIQSILIISWQQVAPNIITEKMLRNFYWQFVQEISISNWQFFDKSFLKLNRLWIEFNWALLTVLSFRCCCCHNRHLTLVIITAKLCALSFKFSLCSRINKS